MRHLLRRLDFRGDLAISVALHVVVLSWLWLHRPVMLDVSMPGTISVDLVGGPAQPADVAGPPTVKPEPTPARHDEIALPKRTPKKLPPPAPRKEPAPHPAQVPAAAPGPPAPIAGAEAHIGMSGAPGATTDPRLGVYLLQVRRKIGENWQPPGVGSMTKATVSFVVDRRGGVSRIHLETPSGNRVFDDLALRAVQNAAPLPPLPDFFSQNELGVYFDFELTH